MRHGTARNNQSVSIGTVRRARRQDQRLGLQRFDHQDAGWSRVRLGPGRTASWRDMPQSLDPPGRTEQLAASPALARRQTSEQEASRRPASWVLPAEERSRANRRSGSVCRSSVETIALHAFPSASRSEWLICTRNGTMVKPQEISKYGRQVFRSLGIPPTQCRFHMLRHTSAMRVYRDSGNDIVCAQRHLGHTNPKTTEIYLSVVRDRPDSSKVKLRLDLDGNSK